MSFGHSVELRNLQLEQWGVRAGNGALLQAYDGTRPATGGPATVKLAEWVLGTPFAPTVASGLLQPTLPSDTVGLAVGQIGWYRIVRSDGTTPVTDFGPEMVTVNNTNVAIGAVMAVTGFRVLAGNA